MEEMTGDSCRERQVRRVVSGLRNSEPSGRRRWFGGKTEEGKQGVRKRRVRGDRGSYRDVYILV